MGIIFIIFLLILLIGACGLGKPKGDFLSRETTSSVNGYFLTTVFMTHFIQYTSSDMYHAVDWFYISVNRALGQLIVALFLFYSGYGIMESIKNKPGYMRSFPVKRIFLFAIDFEIAAMIYLVVSCVTGNAPTLRYAVKGFLAWESLGNSNWYVFAIMYLYLITWISFCRPITCRSTKLSVGLVIMFSVLYILVMSRHKGGWWYDTILCYGAGMVFSCCVERIRDFFFEGGEEQRLHTGRYVLLTVGLAAAFAVTYRCRSSNVCFFELLAVLFSLLVVMATMKFKTVSSLYCFIGKNLFCFYIYQRIPMIVFQDSLGSRNIYLYFAVCLAVTAGICGVMIPFYRWLHGKFLLLVKTHFPYFVR